MVRIEHRQDVESTSQRLDEIRAGPASGHCLDPAPQSWCRHCRNLRSVTTESKLPARQPLVVGSPKTVPRAVRVAADL